MNKIYGLRNDKENITLIIANDEATLITQTAEGFEFRELNLQFDLENEKEISADKVKPINISANEITSGDIAKITSYALKGIANNANVDSEVEITEDGIKVSSEKIKVRVGELRTQTNFLMSKVDYLETKLKEKDEEISKLKDLVNAKVSSKEFWDFVKYYKDETQQKEQPKPIQRALNRIEGLDRVTDVRIDEEFKATDFNISENRLTITIDYLDVGIAKKMKKAGKCKLD